MTFTTQYAVSQLRKENDQRKTKELSLMIIHIPRYADGNLSRCHALATPLSAQRKHRTLFPTCMSTRESLGPRGREP